MAAANPGGVAGLGAGAGFGQAMANAFQPAGGGTSGTPKEDAFALLEKMHDLLKKGVLTQEEFDRKKADLLSRI